MRFAYYAAAFLFFNLVDYKKIADEFRDGKVRWLALSLVPVTFVTFRRHLSWAPAYFGALAVFSFAINDYRQFSCFPLLLILGTLVMSCVLVKQGEDFFARSLMIMGAFQAGIAILQTLGVHLIFTPVLEKEYYNAVGLIGHATILGPTLVAALCPALWRKHYLLSALIIAAILATKSSMTYASLVAVVLIYLWRARGVAWAFGGAALILAAAAAAYLLYPQGNAWRMTGRAVLWEYGWRAFMENPLWGFGPGSWMGIFLPRYKREFVQIFETQWPKQLHNDYMEFLIDYGILPALPLLVALGQFLRGFRPTWTHAICVGLLVNAGANFPLCLPPTAMILVVAWAYCFKIDCTKKPR